MSNDVNYADFAGDDDGPVASAAPEQAPVKQKVEAVADDGMDFDLPKDEVEGDGEQEQADAVDDDLIDELDLPDDETEAQSDLIEIDEDTKLSRAEIKEMLEKKAEYSRYSDELAIVDRERQTLKKITDTYHESTQYVTAHYHAAVKLAEAMIPAEPSMELMRSNPDAYLAQKTYRDNIIKYYEEAKREQVDYVDQANKRSEANFTGSQAERAQAEIQKLLKAVPQLKNDKKAEGYLKSIEDFGSKYGYSQGDIRAAVAQDHRLALIMRKAALYDAKVASKPNPILQKSQTIPVATRPAQVSQKTADRQSLSVALKKASTGNSNRPQSLREVGKFFNAD